MSGTKQPVSIHAPVRERLFHGRFLSVVVNRFNSRSREGATACTHPFILRGKHVSIHAPVRERPDHKLKGGTYTLFQFTLP